MYVCIKYMFWMDRVVVTGDRTRPLGSGLPVWGGQLGKLGWIFRR